MRIVRESVILIVSIKIVYGTELKYAPLRIFVRYYLVIGRC